MQLTIRQKLFGLTICSLLLLAGVSFTGYWGISSSVQSANREGAAIGAAIRSHVDARYYNDMTHEDISAMFAKKDQERQDSIDNLALHSQKLEQAVTTAQQSISDPALRSALDDEAALMKQYVSATGSLANAILHSPSTAASESSQCMQLYDQLQSKIDDTGDQLEAGAKTVETVAATRAQRAVRVLFAMCAFSLLLLFGIAVKITRSITR